MLQFLKLGGSLITDKTTAYTPRSDTIARLATEVCQALEAATTLARQPLGKRLTARARIPAATRPRTWALMQ